MKISKLVVSIGAAVVATKVAKAFSNFGVDDVLDYVGLERRRGHGWEKLALFGAGALYAGAGAGLLLAPASGKKTRERIAKGADNLTTRATEALADIQEHAAELGRGSGDERAEAQHHNGGSQGR